MSKKRKSPALWELDRNTPYVYTYKADRRLRIVKLEGCYLIYWHSQVIAEVRTTVKLAKEKAMGLIGEKLNG